MRIAKKHGRGHEELGGHIGNHTQPIYGLDPDAPSGFTSWGTHRQPHPAHLWIGPGSTIWFYFLEDASAISRPTYGLDPDAPADASAATGPFMDWTQRHPHTHQ
jgi:hypothetical protein